MATLSDKAGFLIAANFIKYAVGFTLPMLMVRLLDKPDYGTYQQLLLVNSMALGLLTMGLPSSIFFFFNRISRGRRAALVRQTITMLALAGVVAGVGIALAAPAIANRASNPSLTGLLPVYAVAVGLMLAGEHFTSFMVAQDRYACAVAFELSETVVRVIALVLPVLLGFGLPGLVICAVLYAFGRLAVRTIWILRSPSVEDDLAAIGEPRTFFVGEQLAYSIPLWLTSIVGVTGGMLDRAIVAGAFRPVDYAIYSVGALSVPLDVIFQASVADVLRASLPPLVQRGELAEVARLLRESVRKLALVILPSFVFLYGFAHEFITLLFTNQYADSVHVFRIYLYTMPLWIFTLSLVPQVFGATRINLHIVLVSTVVHLVLSFTLLKLVGFYGPALSGVISTYVSTGIYLAMAMSLVKVPLAQLVPYGRIAATLGCCALALVVAELAAVPSFGKLIALSADALVFGIVYLGSALAFGVFTSADRSLARRWLGRITPASPPRGGTA